jgi:hypothetical protein
MENDWPPAKERRSPSAGVNVRRMKSRGKTDEIVGRSLGSAARVPECLLAGIDPDKCLLLIQ